MSLRYTHAHTRGGREKTMLTLELLSRRAREIEAITNRLEGNECMASAPQLCRL